eukprot:365749-Chlamydomonas_euryale.AAC.10
MRCAPSVKKVSRCPSATTALAAALAAAQICLRSSKPHHLRPNAPPYDTRAEPSAAGGVVAK